MKKFASVLLAMVLCFFVAQTKVSALTSGDYTYTVTSSRATITDYNGKGRDVVIPSKLGGYTVTAIGDNAFYDGVNISSMTIPSGVIKIGQCAFEGCRSLQSVTIPSGLKEIGVAAFYDCVNLRYLTLPAGISKIANYTFSGCSNLSSLNIPTGVTDIGEGAFDSCSSLEGVTLSSGLTKLGQWVFRNCRNFSTITIPAGVTEIGASAFSGCANLKTITVDSGNTAYSSSGGVLFNKNKTLLIDCPEGKSGSYSIPSSVTEIGASGFYGCEKLTGVNIPNGVTKIGTDAFSSSGLTGVTIPGSVNEIGSWAFAFSDDLHYALFLGNAPSVWGDYGFDYCASDFKIYYLSGADFSNPWHGYTTAIFTLSTPGSLSALSDGYDRVSLQWGGVTGATGYSIYRSENSTSGFVKIASTKTTSYISKNLTTGKTYYYKVRAYCSGSSGTIYSSYTAVKSAKPVPATPVISSAASAGYNSVLLKWNAVSGATGYEIYRSTNSTSGFAKIASSSTTSYTNKSLSTGKKYYYKVKAYRTVDSVRIYGAISTAKSAKPVPATPVISSAASAGYNSVLIKWGKVSGASGYVIYRSTSSISGFVKIASSSSTSYTSKSLTTGKTYYYKVKAYRTVDSVKIYGAASSAKSVKPVPSAPSSASVVKASSSSIKISWKAVNGASGYHIYRAESKTGTYTRVKTLTSTSYTNSGLNAGKTYYYKIRAYRVVGSTKVYGTFSAVVSLKL